jgi:3-deoxy-D-manno-octulosonic acid kinase
MSQTSVSEHNNCWILTNQAYKSKIDCEWFSDTYWLNQGRLLGASSGRGSAWMVKSDQEKMMLRHYYRGGIPAKFNKDKYLWTGLNKSRSFSEFYLLEKMYKMGLPVPEPIAAQTCKIGLLYQANILIKYIPHQSTFAAFLNKQSNKSTWQKVGQTIALFHRQGINHADLNANNILIDENKVYLIDFDNSGQQSPKLTWQQNNLKRLKRSIDKLTNQPYTHINNTKWQQLIEAYQQEMKQIK